MNSNPIRNLVRTVVGTALMGAVLGLGARLRVEVVVVRRGRGEQPCGARHCGRRRHEDERDPTPAHVAGSLRGRVSSSG